MDRENFGNFRSVEIETHDDSDYSEDNISDYREERQRKFDQRASKKARAGRHESRKKDKGFQRTSKEDRHSRW